MEPVYFNTFLKQGPFYVSEEIETLSNISSAEFIITVDEIQQHLLYHSVTSDDIDNLILLDVECNNFPFTLGYVIDVDDETVTVEIYVSSSNEVIGPWNAVSDLIRQLPKIFCFSKKVQLTQKNTLKKRFVNQICKKYNL
jgi:hypothetical protein